jgi:hypothetical protein
MKTLIPSAYSPNVTRLDGSAFGSTTRDPLTGSEAPAILRQERTGPIRTTPIVFQLVANVPLNILQANPHRKGLLLTNKDAVANLFISFGTVADANSFPMAPGAVMLLDFITPTDAVWCFATANVAGVCFEFSRMAG